MKLLKKTVLFTLSLGTNLDLPTQTPFEFSYELLYLLVPFKPVSIRGAIMSLKDEGFVSVYQRNKQTYMALTSVGREALRALFPGFKLGNARRDHTWTICLSKSESLRLTLEQAGFLRYQIGVYLLPKSIPQELTKDLVERKALNQVLIFETRRLLIGDEEQVVAMLFPITKISAMRQNITKILNTIGKKARLSKQLHPQTKTSFLSLLPKLMEYFMHELTTPDIYFPQEILLSDTKSLLFEVSREILPKLLLH